jgi:hypothetical protein
MCRSSGWPGWRTVSTDLVTMVVMWSATWSTAEAQKARGVSIAGRLGACSVLSPPRAALCAMLCERWTRAGRGQGLSPQSAEKHKGVKPARKSAEGSKVSATLNATTNLDLLENLERLVTRLLDTLHNQQGGGERPAHLQLPRSQSAIEQDNSMCDWSGTYIDEDARVRPFCEIPLRLLEQLAREKHVRRGAVACDVILCGRRARDDGGRRVLDLLRAQNHVR